MSLFLIFGNTSCIDSKAENAFDLGIKNVQAGYYKSAIIHFTRAIKIEPEYAEAYFNRAIAREKIGYIQGALSDYNRVIKLEPDMTETYLHRGNIWMIYKNYYRAINDFNKAIESDPDLLYTYMDRALANYKLGRIKSACRDWRKAKSLGFSNAGLIIQTYCR